MKFFAPIVTLILLFGVQPTFAHNDHTHEPISEAMAHQLAKEATIQLTERDEGLGFGKLPASWTETPAAAVTTRKKGSGYYIVSVTNEIEAKTLYVLMSSGGEVYDANFTGKFDDLK